jgi:class 3 adenylate cyclase
MTEEARRTQALLLSILPRATVRSLQLALSTAPPATNGTGTGTGTTTVGMPVGVYVTAETLDHVTIFFTDMVGFTTLASSLPAARVVALLNALFSEVDRLVEVHGLEKIKTLGDAYMACGGVPLPLADHAERVVRMAMEALAAVAAVRARTGAAVHMRVGVHTGRVAAGVMGAAKFAYDVWSDDVDVASKMEATGRPDRIHLSGATAACLPPTMAATLEPGEEVDLGPRLGVHATFYVPPAELPITATTGGLDTSAATGMPVGTAEEGRDGPASAVVAAAAAAVVRARGTPRLVRVGGGPSTAATASVSSASVGPHARPQPPPPPSARTHPATAAAVQPALSIEVSRDLQLVPVVRFRDAAQEAAFRAKLRRMLGALAGSVCILLLSVVALTVVDVLSFRPASADLVAGIQASPPIPPPARALTWSAAYMYTHTVVALHLTMATDGWRGAILCACVCVCVYVSVSVPVSLSLSIHL